MDLFKEDIEKLVKETLTIEEQRELSVKLHKQTLKDLNKLRFDFSLIYPNKMTLLDYVVTTPYDKIGIPKKEINNDNNNSDKRDTPSTIAHTKYRELNNAGLIDKSNKFVGVNEDGTIIYGQTLVSVLKQIKNNAYCCATNGSSIIMSGYV